MAACSSSIRGGPDPNAGVGAGAGAPGDPKRDPGAAAATSYQASSSEARRLSRGEIDRTLRDLLGDETAPATRLLAEDLYAPYDNDYRSQTASGALIDSLEGMAGDVAKRVLADPVLRARLVPCTPSAAGDSKCFRQVVEDFGRRALRRPLASDEVDGYLTLLEFATLDAPSVPHDFYTAVELFVRAVLQDPEFLYRIETGTRIGGGDVYALDDHEIATRMSYLLWGSTPDDRLSAAADMGELHAPEQRRTLARRMLEDPRAREQLHRFHGMWLGYRALPHPAELTQAFQRETSALIDRIVFDEPQSYLALFTERETYLDDNLADHYALPHPAGGPGWVDYGSSGRAGILSHGSVLAAFSKFTDTSPTQRGIFVRTRLLCQRVDPPPVNVNADNPPGNKDAVCKADRYAEHSSNGACAGCHAQLDPIGFGLEHFDMAGRARTHDEGLPQCAISGQGTLTGHGDFSGPAELGRLLVERNLVQPCLVRQLYQFAAGREPEPDELAPIASLGSAFAAGGYRLTDLIVDYVASEAFALRKEPENP